MDDHEINPIVAMATKLRARRDLGSAIDSAAEGTAPAVAGDAEASLRAFAEAVGTAAKRLNSILGKNGVTFVRLEKPLRLRVRFRDKRVTLDLDAARQLVLVRGEGLEGEYQFDSGAVVPSLINLSKLSTDAGYREALTAPALLKLIAQDAELPRPSHLDGPGPLSF